MDREQQHDNTEREERVEEDGGHDGSAAWLGGNTAEAIPARFHNGGETHLFRSRVFIVPQRERDSGPTENGRRNFDNIQRQVRRLRRAAEVETIPPGS